MGFLFVDFINFDVRCLHLVVVANAGAFTWRDGNVDDEVVVDVVDVDVVDVVDAPFSSPP